MGSAPNPFIPVDGSLVSGTMVIVFVTYSWQMWDPFQIVFLWPINGGDSNYFLTGMILQVEGFEGRPCLQVRFLPGTHYLATAGRDHMFLGAGMMVFG